MGVFVGVTPGVGVFVGVTIGVEVSVGVTPGVGVLVGVTPGVEVSVGVTPGVDVLVGVALSGSRPLLLLALFMALALFIHTVIATLLPILSKHWVWPFTVIVAEMATPFASFCA